MKRYTIRPTWPQKLTTIAGRTAAAWNRKYSHGQWVRFWTAPKDTTPAKGMDRVQGRAFVDQGTAVVLLQRTPGLFPVVRIEAITK